MSSMKRLSNGKWRARYKDSDGRGHCRHFTLRRDAETWLALGVLELTLERRPVVVDQGVPFNEILAAQEVHDARNPDRPVGSWFPGGCCALTRLEEPCGRPGNEMVGPVLLCEPHANKLRKAMRTTLYESHVLPALLAASREKAEMAEMRRDAKAERKRIVALTAKVERLMSLLQEREPVVTAVRVAIIARDGRECHYCGGGGTAKKGPDGRSWHIDHALPVVRGGGNHLSNLVLSCASCNLRKHDMTAEEFLAKLDAERQAVAASCMEPQREWSEA